MPASVQRGGPSRAPRARRHGARAPEVPNRQLLHQLHGFLQRGRCVADSRRNNPNDGHRPRCHSSRLQRSRPLLIEKRRTIPAYQFGISGCPPSLRTVRRARRRFDRDSWTPRGRPSIPSASTRPLLFRGAGSSKLSGRASSTSPRPGGFRLVQSTPYRIKIDAAEKRVDGRRAARSLGILRIAVVVEVVKTRPWVQLNDSLVRLRT